MSKKKSENIILFFANKSKNREIDILKLMKLIWLSDKVHLNQYGRLITKDSYRAMPHGPVASETYELAKQSTDKKEVLNLNDRDEYTRIRAITETNLDYLSKTDIAVMEQIWEEFGVTPAWGLRQYSHNFKEWVRFEEQIEDPTQISSYAIEMDDFFELREGVCIDPIKHISEEQRKASKEYYMEQVALQNLLNA